MSIIGVVDNCSDTVVHEFPDEVSDILGIIPRHTEVVIDEDESTDDFYKICTASSIEGYCDANDIMIYP